MRPTERPGAGLRELSDADAPDFLDAHRVALLAFLDGGDPHSAKMRVRLSVIAAKWEAAGPVEGPAADSLARAAGKGGSTAKRAPFGAGVVEVTRSRLVAEALAVKSVPTVILFVEGEVVDRLMGVAPEAVLDGMAERAFALLATRGPHEA